MSTASFQQVGSKPPPPAPPLPPQRYGQRAATAIARLAHPFLYGSRPSSAQGHRDPDAGPTGFQEAVPQSSSPLSPSPSSSRSVSHRTGIPINALDISPDRTHVVLAGRDILKTVRVNDTTCAEDFNLRAHITAYASAHNASRDAVSAQHRDQLTANDVKWSNKLFDTCIAIAATSGRIVVYDVNRPSLEIVRYHEHARQVHQLAFSPYQGALLISGSQDGTVRMWDLRARQGEKSVRTVSIRRFSGNSDGVRDVRWSPTDGVEFAAATDSGAVMRWDFRKENAPLLKINAHDRSCHSIDWHPSGKYLASAGADKQVKIWDFKSSDRRMKPSWSFRTPQAVFVARWRPCDSLSSEGVSDSHMSSQIATSYHGKDPRIHVWDLNRPHIPYQEFDRHESVASDFLWHSEERLWSVGSAGMFVQTDMSTVPKPIDRQNLNVLATTPDSRFCYFSDTRTRRRFSATDEEEDFPPSRKSGETSGDKFSGSQSANEGSLEEQSMLNSNLQIRRQKSVASRLTSVSASTPTKDAESAAKETTFLDPTFLTTQIAASGYVLGVFDAAAYSHLARNYQLPVVEEMLADTNLPFSIRATFEQNALAAAQTGHYRLAQTWRIIGLATQRALEPRAADVKDGRTRHSKPSRPASTVPEHPIFEKVRFGPAGETKQSLGSHLQNSGHIESSSNIATPLVRPAQGASAVPVQEEDMLDHGFGSQSSNTALDQQFVQPAVRASLADSDISPGELVPWTSLSPKTQSVAMKESSSMLGAPPFESPDVVAADLEKRRLTLNAYRGQPRSLLKLEDLKDGGKSPTMPIRVERHDSNESFQMFSASVDSDPRSVPFVGSFGESRRSDASDQASVSLSQSMRQELANSILANNLSSRPPEARRPSMLPPPPHPPPEPVPPLTRPSVERKESSSADGESANAQIHAPVVRPAEAVNFRSSFGNGDRPIAAPIPSTSSTKPTSPSSNPFLPPKDPFSRPDLDLDLDTLPTQPWSLPALLPPLMDYHLDTLSDVQLPALLTLHLHPLFPSLFPAPERVAAYLRAYHARLTALQLHLDAASFRNACAALFPDLAQGMTLGASEAGLWCTRCEKPVKGDVEGWCARCDREWGPCGVCESVVPPAQEMLRGEARRFARRSDGEEAGGGGAAGGDYDTLSKHAADSRGVSPGAIPGGEGSDGNKSDDNHELGGAVDGDNYKRTTATTSSGTLLWAWCQGCGHGGHDACLRAWFAASHEVGDTAPRSSSTTTTTTPADDTAAPTATSTVADDTSNDLPFPSSGICHVPYCGHDCMPGRARTARRRAALRSERERSKSRGVVRDEWSVAESRAVEGARRLVAGGAATPNTGRGRGRAADVKAKGLGLGSGNGVGIGARGGGGNAAAAAAAAGGGAGGGSGGVAAAGEGVEGKERVEKGEGKGRDGKGLGGRRVRVRMDGGE